MRSRYTAFVVEDRDYLRDTWHPRTRPGRVDLGPGERWTGLEVLHVTGGGLFDTSGTVAFHARHRDGVVAEDSAFARHDGRWSYVGPAHVSDPSTTGRRHRP